ncbi:hypothetical protein CCR97_10195 [Rhodoplanes elegans]|uniref:Terminase n=1 Tax=Rhodoplanes elegans TaxID=29408 RepID=A0A327KQ43_9BRAD|nr:P27 family phage terminase small subunit [Rhodoplanes elegans]MBK5958576.1 hypothetical protein [Rhodoplanes elegans]RAI40531.1 hypothetical protein CH338_05965 [Rhodoplanes elegans]
MTKQTTKVTVPPPPAHLDKAAAALWKKLATSLARRGVLSDSTGPLLAAYCSDAALVAVYGAALKREGAIVTTDGVSKPHPLARPYAQATARMLSFARRLRLLDQPQAPPGPKSAYDALGLFD